MRPRWSTHLKCGNRTEIGLGGRNAGARGETSASEVGVDPIELVRPRRQVH
jgi:hypothetical protein